MHFPAAVSLWMIPVGFPQRIGRTGVRGLLFCEDESGSLLFQQPNTSQREYKWITDFKLSPAHCPFIPDSSLCLSVFAGWVFLVWYKGKSLKYIQLCFVEGLSFSVLFLNIGFFFPAPSVLHSFRFHIHALFVFFKVGKGSQLISVAGRLLKHFFGFCWFFSLSLRFLCCHLWLLTSFSRFPSRQMPPSNCSLKIRCVWSLMCAELPLL